jgi:hypothetical protein
VPRTDDRPQRRWSKKGLERVIGFEPTTFSLGS